MTASVIGPVVGFVVGAVLAGVLNLELFGYAAEATHRRSESATVMRWIMRSLLVLAPLAFAAIGLTQGDAILGSLP